MCRRGDQLIGGNEGMAVLGAVIVQKPNDTRPQTVGGIFIGTEGFGNTVGCLKADAVEDVSVIYKSNGWCGLGIFWSRSFMARGKAVKKTEK